MRLIFNMLKNGVKRYMNWVTKKGYIITPTGIIPIKE